MTHNEFGVLSNDAITGAAIVYFLAFLAHIAEWANARGGTPHVSSSTATPTPPAGTTSSAGATPLLESGESAGDTLVATVRPRLDEGSVAGAGTRPGAGAGSDGNHSGDERAHRVARYGRIGVALTVVAALAHLVALLSRGLANDPARVPWGNMYEFTMTGTFVVTLFYLVLFRRYRLGWLGPVVTGFVVTVLMVAVLVLYEPASPLTPALHSPWLVIHVVAAIIATGAFTVGGMTSVLFLLKERAERRGTLGSGYLGRLPATEVLDRVSYRMHAFGFPVWTFAALIAGPIWAQYAWSRYWGWDPKEIWAFITWVVYAAYLHARATAGWRGGKAAVVALMGLATLWFNFVGINFFFGQGSQHSYALVQLILRR